MPPQQKKTPSARFHFIALTLTAAAVAAIAIPLALRRQPPGRVGNPPGPSNANTPATSDSAPPAVAAHAPQTVPPLKFLPPPARASAALRPLLAEIATNALHEPALRPQELLTLAAAQLQLDDPAGARTTLALIDKVPPPTGGLAALFPHIIRLAALADAPDLARAHWQKLLPLPTADSDARWPADPLAAAIAAAHLGDESSAVALTTLSCDRAAAARAPAAAARAPGAAARAPGPQARPTTGAGGTYALMLPYNILAGQALRKGDEATAQRLWAAYIGLLEKYADSQPHMIPTSPAVPAMPQTIDLASRLPNGTDLTFTRPYEASLPVPLQFALRDLAAGNPQAAVARIADLANVAGDPRAPARHSRLLINTLVLAHRAKDAAALAPLLDDAHFEGNEPTTHAALLANTLSALGDSDLVVDLVGQPEPGTGNAFRRAFDLAARGRRDDAIQIFAAPPAADTPGNRRARADVLLQLGAADAARPFLDDATRSAGLVEAHLSIPLYLRLGDPAGAQNAFNASFKTANGKMSPAARIDAATDYLNGGDLAAVTRLLPADLPDFAAAAPDDLARAAHVLAAAGQFDAAAALAARLRDARPHDSLLLDVAQCAIEAGDAQRVASLLADFQDPGQRGAAETQCAGLYLATGLAYDPADSPFPVPDNRLPSLIAAAFSRAYPHASPDALLTRIRALRSPRAQVAAALGLAQAQAAIPPYEPLRPNSLALGAHPLTLLLPVDRSATVRLTPGLLSVSLPPGPPPAAADGAFLPLYLNGRSWYPVWLQNPADTATIPLPIGAVFTGWTLDAATLHDLPSPPADAVSATPTHPDDQTLQIDLRNNTPTPRWLRLTLTYKPALPSQKADDPTARVLK